MEQIKKRELKFKVWNGKKFFNPGHPQYDTALWFDDGYWLCISHFTGENEVICDSRTNPDAALVQYTGLKDRNGKEIYEGDIIQESGSLSVIEYQTDRFICRWLPKDKNFFNDSLRVRYEDVEVIGNIYETPELLK